MTKNSNSMWGGRFAGGLSEIMQTINASIPFDKALWKEDIRGSLVHVAMLVENHIVSAEDGQKICMGLEKIAREYAENGIEENLALEDIHMHVEARLSDIIGDAAGRLHTARSRNDQVATDFKLWVRSACDAADKALLALQKALVGRAEEHADTIMPGFTHLQIAQPVTLGHHLMAYYEMFARDRDRFQAARNRLNECPLGAAALAGTGFDIDRDKTAHMLDFDRPTANSLDSVSDRDFALDYLNAAATTAIHLSRLAEEFIIWASQPFGFVSLPDSYSTGSSIMPQKRNPDAAELVRGHSGRIIGCQQALMITMKGLPLAYSKDMQDDKPPVFEAEELFMLAMAAMTGMVAETGFNKDNMYKASQRGFATATDLADWLVRKADIPFRQAHHITGAVVKLAEEKNIALDAIDFADLQAIDDRITTDVYQSLSLEASVASRKSYGGTAPDQVRAQIARAKAAWEE